MAANNGQTHGRPIPIAPALPVDHAVEASGNGEPSQSTMPYTCQTCAKRKVKCDKAMPICSTCRRGRLECLYQAPRPRKRKLNDSSKGETARSNPILPRNGLLPHDVHAWFSTDETPEESIPLRMSDPEASVTGKFLAGQDKSRYIDSSLWRNLGDDEMQRISDDDDEGENQMGPNVANEFASDPLSGAFMGCRQNLLQYHPTHINAMILWRTHVENVEPLCKILHIPSTAKMVETVSQQPAVASKTDECLMFAVYHFAIFSMSGEECINAFGQPRVELMQKYHFAARQALANASFLKTTEMSILQALVLFLLSTRHTYDPHTYWILTGVAVRIAQRMGLHQDGEKLGLPPFEVQMRRRLFYQVLPLDGVAGQMSGVGMGVIPDKWDTKPGLNINDDQIWPGMTETPVEQKGATEMIFCLARAAIGAASIGFWQFKDDKVAEMAISKTESEVEERFIRYCDIVSPLHFLTSVSARSGITAMRLRIRMPKVKNQTATDAEIKELLQLALKILDTDTASYANTGLKRYRWHIRPFFLWGTWDSMILVLTSLLKHDLLSSAEKQEIWNRVEKIYDNHHELLELKRVLYMAFGRLTLKAWDANPPSNNVPEPAFITTLLSRRRRVNLKSRMEKAIGNNITTTDSETSALPRIESSLESDAETLPISLSDNMGIYLDNDLNFDTADWAFWDQLIQDDQTQSQWQDDFSQ